MTERSKTVAWVVAAVLIVVAAVILFLFLAYSDLPIVREGGWPKAI